VANVAHYAAYRILRSFSCRRALEWERRVAAAEAKRTGYIEVRCRGHGAGGLLIRKLGLPKFGLMTDRLGLWVDRSGKMFAALELGIEPQPYLRVVRSMKCFKWAR
jgi:hypothetical protein